MNSEYQITLSDDQSQLQTPHMQSQMIQNRFFSGLQKTGDGAQKNKYIIARTKGQYEQIYGAPKNQERPSLNDIPDVQKLVRKQSVQANKRKSYLNEFMLRAGGRKSTIQQLRLL